MILKNKYNPSTRRWLGWLLMGLAGCVTPYDNKLDVRPAGIVVQGFVSNQPGPYQIQINTPAQYEYSSLSFGVRGASVYITDDLGQREDLIELPTPGVYQTRNLLGQTGRTYQLHIVANGKTYESKPELLRAVSSIEKVYSESYRNVNPITRQDQLGGWRVYIDTKDAPEQGNYYRWNWVHYAQTSQCGVIMEGGQPRYSVYCCTDCWNIFRCTGPGCINVASDALINGNILSRQLVAEVPVGCRDRYYLEVEQQAISREAYVYWKTVKQLLQNTGGVFDVAPAGLQGNLRCVSDPSEQVFGFFEVVGISRVGHYVDRTQSERTLCPMPLPSPSMPPPCLPCLESAYRTPKEPAFWVK
ncbi:hypothetical protein GCM10027275_54830 [Rhabdobacter roseus]|uniref:DUF4249 domain-containing protein n=1 Tax=Rhabdobacter roseus TaxID=1655419 RepID=A0A840U5A9_9BACT|nr:DUF4249 family protein [Rhabdobacter roseus]MBB5287498.1 hypothetical protein [Rhabdobacter roseus]